MVKLCPKCRSKDIEPYMGGMFGSYLCNKCGYTGAMIIEKQERPKKNVQNGV